MRTRPRFFIHVFSDSCISLSQSCKPVIIPTMHRQLRSAVQRNRDGPLSAHLQRCIRSFSTTQPRPDDEEPRLQEPQQQPRPTLRQRSAAAASQLGGLTSSNEITKEPPRGWSSADPARAAGAPQIINVSSLPARRGGGISVRGRGGFLGRGGTPQFGLQRAGAQGITSPGRGRGGARGGAGRGVRGRGGRGRGRGGRREAQGRDEDDDEDDDYKGLNETERVERRQQRSEQQMWLQGQAEGVDTKFNPSLTLDGLVGYGPAVATSTSVSLGQVEGVMRSLRALGGGAPFCDDTLNPSRQEEQWRLGEDVFFDTLAEREAVNGVKGPSEATKAAVLKNVVQGVYERPKFATADDVLGMVKSYIARNETYRPQDGPSLESAISSLLSRPVAAAATKATPPQS